MCEINPVHKKFFRLEVYTSNTEMTVEEFEIAVASKLIKIKQQLNQDMMFRFHIHEEVE